MAPPKENNKKRQNPYPVVSIWGGKVGANSPKQWQWKTLKTCANRKQKTQEDNDISSKM